MGVNLNRDLYAFLQSGHKFCGLYRNQKSCHIFDTDGICTHIFDFFCNVLPVIQGVGITQGIGQGHLCMSLFLIGCFDSCLKISDIIQTVKNTDDIDTVGDGFLYEVFHHIIGIMAISQNILASEQHLKFCIFKSVSQLSQSVPRIFLQETKGCVKCGAAPALYGMIAYLVHLVHDGQHLFGCHSGSDQGLMCVTQHCLGNTDRFFNDF